MKIKELNFCLIVFFFCCLIINSQENNQVVQDSLKKFTYQDLYDAYKLSSKDTVKSLVYLNAFLEKGIRDKNKIKIAQAYSFLHFYQKNETTKLEMLDKAIHLSKYSEHNFFPTVPYSFKGGHFYKKGDYKKSLDNYLLALKFAHKTGNTEYIYITKHNIGEIKAKIGFYDEALLVLKECYEYEKDKKSKDIYSYLSSIVILSETYTKANKIDSSSIFINKGIKLAKENSKEIYNRLILNAGVNLFYSNNYDKAYDSIHKSITFLKGIDDKSFLITGHFYLGEIELDKGNEEEAMIHFKKVDSIHEITKNPSEKIRKTYEHLIKYTKSKGEFNKELVYIEKLLKFDSLTKINNTYIEEKMNKEYSTLELLFEKDKIIGGLENKNFTMLIIVIFLTVLLAIGLFLFNYDRHKINQENFEEFLNANSLDNAQKSENAKVSKEDYVFKIPKEIVNRVLHDLINFEEKECFLKPDITCVFLAKDFETNPKYLSKIIHHYRQKNFNTYINDLRIDYIISKLNEDKTLRQYTIKAISESCGFNTRDAFSKSFYKKTGVYPSYFIKRIEDNDEPT
ncbi:hypothetical protein AWE51_18860 [Aquimarina aggregata]|uniref:HTH araC/xylS-type domain-containing protein n=1 Tax=Aquimarina aggregata TaxID=1642818 RepID=A0A162WHN5_9FLAO|nr:AraC family transcriptional regulator [Aquimarina aggregata]KZS38108.1 hypothetical protein AWE51_18860 [Aquimarina aggregata]